MSSVATILLVEGARPAVSLAPSLESKGYGVIRASNGKEASSRIRNDTPALVVIDCTTLHTDGLKICSDLRSHSDAVPIVLVVRQGTDLDQINCADTTLVRPFTPRKLLNRIMRLLPNGTGEVLQSGHLTLNIDNRCLWVGKAEHHLTPMQTRLLEAFLRRPGEVLSREYLMKNVWKTSYTGDTRTIEVHIRWLRKIIESDASRPKLLQTIRGVGYRLVI
jgi:two-component system alkaline phosphatase synthesis response regulator PhoP